MPIHLRTSSGLKTTQPIVNHVKLQAMGIMPVAYSTSHNFNTYVPYVSLWSIIMVSELAISICIFSICDKTNFSTILGGYF
jgi:hypothetical protein